MEKIRNNKLLVRILQSQKSVPLFFFAVIWSLLLIGTGTLTSGFHFIDDHEFVRIAKDLETNNVLDVAKDWIERDLDLRFRPAYFAHRVFSVYLLDANILLLSIQNLVLLILSSYLLFKTFRNLRFGVIYSYIFVLLSLLGPQMVIWWRLGPNETIGLFTFTTSIFLLTESYIPGSRKIYKPLSVLFMLLATLSKESFIMMVPAYMLLNTYLYHRRYEVKLVKNIFSNKVLNSTLFVSVVAELYIIIYEIGTNKIGYAGVDTETSTPIKVLSALKSMTRQLNFELLFVSLGIWIFIFTSSFIKAKKLDFKILKQTTFASFIFLAVIGPQALLYAKSGIFERYLIPSSIGFGFFVIFIFRQALIEVKVKNLRYFLMFVFATLLAYSLINQFKIAVEIANDFTKTGKSINQAINQISESTEGADSILIVADPVVNYEEAYSLKHYLSDKDKKENIYVLVLKSNENDTEFERALESGFAKSINTKEVNDLNSMEFKAIWLFKNTEKEFNTMQSKSSKNRSFVTKDFGNFRVLTK